MVLPIPSGSVLTQADIDNEGGDTNFSNPQLDGDYILDGVSGNSDLDFSTWEFIPGSRFIGRNGTNATAIVAASQIGNVSFVAQDLWTPQSYLNDGGGLVAWFDADDADLTNGQLQWASKVGSLALSSTFTTWTKTSRESILNPLGNPNWEFSSILAGVKAIFLVIAYTATQFTRFVATNSSNFPLAGNGTQLQASSGSPDFAIAKNGDDLTGYAASQPISWASPTNTTGPDLLWIAVDPLSSWSWGLIDMRNNQQAEIRAILALTELPSQADRQRFEGWAARLSTGTPNLVDKLPVIHPYKDDAPVGTGGVSSLSIVAATPTLTLVGLISGSRIYIRNTTDNVVLYNASEPTSQFSNTVEAGKSLLIRVRNASGSPKYKTFETTTIMPDSNLSITINQELDE